ncbi:signal peptidase II [Desulfoferrobacter suflitae]|uniref:signal peptidase II n=1 Tax=Desulfoferrobacter suflitae TaxID=2865782 RepID=UPI0021642DF5|nr:signal peptidase II [Desulfoferrobacter suflitae]MCK8600217.1 signal peptidase II [Desulfoferrobacter suflitae]
MFNLFLIGGGIVIFDQLTKILVVYLLPLHSSVAVIPGFFNLVHVRNTGAAFSFLAGSYSGWRQIFFVSVSLIGIAVILFVYRGLKKEDRWARISLGLIFGGAVGNLIDRLRLGEVIDFLDVYLGQYHWPAFNVADSAISIGAVMLLLCLLKTKNHGTAVEE